MQLQQVSCFCCGTVHVTPDNIDISFPPSHLHVDGSDFILVGAGTLLFPPGSTLAAINVQIIEDELPESTEFFTLKLMNAPDVILTTDLALVTISDDDSEAACMQGRTLGLEPHQYFNLSL